MELFWILTGILSVVIVGSCSVAAVTIWICNATDPCKHSYEIVDTCNDKKIVLVCRRCGKIKRLRK